MIMTCNVPHFQIHVSKQRQKKELCVDPFPISLSENSLDLTPSVLTHPSVSTSLVGVDGNRLGGSITVAGRAHPVILILQDNDGR